MVKAGAHRERCEVNTVGRSAGGREDWRTEHYLKVRDAPAWNSESYEGTAYVYYMFERGGSSSLTRDR